MAGAMVAWPVWERVSLVSTLCVETSLLPLCGRMAVYRRDRRGASRSGVPPETGGTRVEVGDRWHEKDMGTRKTDAPILL